MKNFANAISAPVLATLMIAPYIDTDGNDLGTVETVDSGTRAKTSNGVSNQSPVGEWILLDTGAATAPAGTAAVQAFTLYVDFSGSNTAQGVYFDDLVLCNLDSDGCKAE